jgi:hypothetical protein
MTFYLLVKTHNITGLKYLCKTSKKNYHTYTGSGLYWKDHLKLHGKNFTTELLRECKSNEEVKEWGQYYSNLWNIVNAKNLSGKKIWANLVPEEGQGVLSETNKLIQNRPEVKVKNIAAVKEFYKNNPHVREQHRQKALLDNPMNKSETRQKHKESMTQFTGEKNKSCDLRLHRFQHESGIIEYCTQTALKMKYNLKKCGISQLVNGHKTKSYGWSLA